MFSAQMKARCQRRASVRGNQGALIANDPPRINADDSRKDFAVQESETADSAALRCCVTAMTIAYLLGDSRAVRPWNAPW